MQKAWLVALTFVVWLSSWFSLQLKVQLTDILFSPKSFTCDMTFPIAAAMGLTSGLVPTALTIFLAKRKPQFARIAFWVALGYAMFWAIVTTACEAILGGKNGVGGGVLLALGFMTVFLPASLLYTQFVVLCPLIFIFGSTALSPLLILLLIAFYFTPPRSWRVGSHS